MPLWGLASPTSTASRLPPTEVMLQPPSKDGGSVPSSSGICHVAVTHSMEGSLLYSKPIDLNINYILRKYLQSDS